MKLIDYIQSELAKAGIEDAAGVNVTFADGRRLNIIDTSHPALAQEVEEGEVTEVKTHASAGAGGRMTW